MNIETILEIIAIIHFIFMFVIWVFCANAYEDIFENGFFTRFLDKISIKSKIAATITTVLISVSIFASIDYGLNYKYIKELKQKKNTSNSFMSTNEYENDEESEEEEVDDEYEEDDEPIVYICTSGKASKYHGRKYCRGLRRCSSSILNVAESKARDMGYAPCSICY